MNDDLIRVVREAAADPRRWPDFDAMAQRARRQRNAARAAAGVGAVAVLASGVFLLASRTDPSPTPVVGQEPPSDGLIPDSSEPRAPATCPTPIQAVGSRIPGTAGSWTPTAPSPLRPRSAASGLWAEDRLIIWGGSDVPGGGFLDGAVLDASTNEWTQIPPAPIATEHGVWDATLETAWDGCRVLLVGTGGWFLDATPSLHAFDLATARWTTLAQPPVVMEDPTAIWTGARLLVVGSDMDDWNMILIGYDPAVDRWESLPAPPLEARSPAVVAATETGLVVFGGMTMAIQTGPACDGGCPLELDYQDGALYDLDRGTWQAIPAPPVPVHSAAGTWAQGRLHVVATAPRPDDTTETVTTAPATYLTYHPAEGWAQHEPPPDGLGGTNLSTVALTTDGRLLAWHPGPSLGGGEAGAIRTPDGTWHPLPTVGLESMMGVTTVWTGEQLVVWGGEIFSGSTEASRLLGDGFVYTPPDP